MASALDRGLGYHHDVPWVREELRKLLCRTGVAGYC